MLNVSLPSFGNTFNANAPAKDILALIVSPEVIAQCLPDVRSFERVDSDNFNVSLDAGSQSLKGRFDFKFNIKKPRDNEVRIEGVGRGSGSTIELGLNVSILELSEKQSQINWQAEMKFSGLLASLGKRILASTTTDYVNRILNNIQKVIGGIQEQP